jgi:hypothetical protein
MQWFVDSLYPVFLFACFVAFLIIFYKAMCETFWKTYFQQREIYLKKLKEKNRVKNTN